LNKNRDKLSTVQIKSLKKLVNPLCLRRYETTDGKVHQASLR
jgi:hypothetical protein